MAETEILNPIDLMDEDELNATELDDDGNIIQPTETKDDAHPAGDDKDEEPPNLDENEPKKNDKTGDDDSSEKEVTGTEKALKDTQKAFHEKSKRVKELEEENRKLKNEQILKKLNSFEKLDEDALERLRDYDPDAYLKYKQDEQAHEDLKAQVKSDEEAFEIEQIDAQNAQLYNNVLEFASKTFGIDTSDEKAVGEFLKSDDFQKVDAEVSSTMQRIDGVYTVDQMEKAWKIVNHDNILAKERQSAREETINTINKPKPTSKLDTLPNSDKSGESRKELKDLTADDWDRMDEEETAYYSKLQRQEDGF